MVREWRVCGSLSLLEDEVRVVELSIHHWDGGEGSGEDAVHVAERCGNVGGESAEVPCGMIVARCTGQDGIQVDVAMERVLNEVLWE